MLVSLNGILQKPGSSFTISGATITFASNLATGDVIDFIILLGDVLNIGTPSDSGVTTASIAANAVTAAKLNNDVISGLTALGAEPADTDEFLVSDAGTIKRLDYSYIKGGGKILQVVNTTHATSVSTTSSSDQASGIFVQITPSATSSKILILMSTNIYQSQGQEQQRISIYRDSTYLGTSGVNGMIMHRPEGSAGQYIPMAMSVFDSPSSTSQIKYEIYHNTSGGTSTISQSNRQTFLTALEIGA